MKGKKKNIFSGYSLSWLFVMYDLPYDTSEAKTAAAKFLRHLKKEGYTKLVDRGKFMIRHCGPGNAEKQIEKIKDILPPDAMVRILQVTDKQFGRMVNLWGKMRKGVW